MTWSLGLRDPQDPPGIGKILLILKCGPCPQNLPEKNNEPRHPNRMPGLGAVQNHHDRKKTAELGMIETETAQWSKAERKVSEEHRININCRYIVNNRIQNGGKVCLPKFYSFRPGCVHREYSQATIQKYTYALTRFFRETDADRRPNRETSGGLADALVGAGYTPATVNANAGGGPTIIRKASTTRPARPNP